MKIYQRIALRYVYSCRPLQSECVKSTCGCCSAVIGCADMTPVYGALITRKGNHVTVRCNQSKEEYQLRCFNMKWVGNVQNCSAGELR